MDVINALDMNVLNRTMEFVSESYLSTTVMRPSLVIRFKKHMYSITRAFRIGCIGIGYIGFFFVSQSVVLDCSWFRNCMYWIGSDSYFHGLDW